MWIVVAYLIRKTQGANVNTTVLQQASFILYEVVQY